MKLARGRIPTTLPAPRAIPPCRYASTALQFYQNRQLELYASKEAKRLTLRQLVQSTYSPFAACGSLK
jgi:hypothetical protein